MGRCGSVFANDCFEAQPSAAIDPLLSAASSDWTPETRRSDGSSATGGSRPGADIARGELVI